MQKRKINKSYDLLEFVASKEDVEKLNSNRDEKVGYIALTSTGAHELTKNNLNYFSYDDVVEKVDFNQLAVEIYNKLSAKLQSLELFNLEYKGLLYNNRYAIFHDLIGVINHAVIIISISNHLNPEKIVIKRSSWWVFNEVQSHYLEKILKDYFASCNKVIKIEGHIGSKSFKKISVLKKIISRNLDLLKTAYQFLKTRKTIKQKFINEEGVILYFGGANYDLLTLHKYLKWINKFYRYININLDNYLNNNWTQYISSISSNIKFKKISDKYKIEVSEMTDFRNDEKPLYFYQFEELFNIDEFAFELIKYLSVRSKSIKSHALKVANYINENVAIKAVMFYDCVNLVNIIICNYFNNINIKTYIYQNGGVYGAQVNQPLSDMVQNHANIFITYGDNIKPINPSKETISIFKPFGSLRLSDASLNSGLNLIKRGRSKKNILWVSEGTSHNTYSLWYQSEDVLRFKFQINAVKKLLTLKNINFIFRPIPNQCSDLSTPDWIRENYSNSLVNITSRFVDLVSWADIVITDVHANTTWDEVLTLNKPLILYLNPQTTKLMPEYSRDLEGALVWCRDETSFLGELEKLSLDPNEYICRYNKNSSIYLSKYSKSDFTILDSLIKEIYQ